MTVTYTGQVANAKLCAFSRLLFYWRGSVYKMMYKEMVIFVILYTILSLTYRFILNDPAKRLFEMICLYCQTFTSLIPLSFVLGFYVAIVVTRWWNMFLNVPWPDRVMMYVTTLIEGFDEHARMIRRTIMRYLSMASLIVFQTTSVVVKKRFPTMDHLIEAGIMTQYEHKALEEVQTPHGKWWVPFVWTFNLIKDARNEGRITDDYMLKALMEEVQVYRGCLGMLYSYDWISIPLVYTQVTTLAVYTFFLGCIFGRQFLDPAQGYEGHDVDLYVPVFTLLQFFFYMGWLKVAEQMINPFGEDDDDFDMNWIIDRNMQISLLTVDDLHQSYPKLQKDAFFDEPAPDYLAYTKSAVSSITQPWLGSTANFNISDEGMQVVTPPMDTIQEESEAPPTCANSQLNINSGATSPMVSPHHTRKHNAGHLQNNLIASLSGIRSTLSLSRGHLDATGNKNNTHSINIGYVQGIDTSRANINRLTNSSRDIHRINHAATAGDNHNATHVLPGGVTRDVRSLLQTLHGSRTISRDSHQNTTMDSPMTEGPSHAVRGRLDSVTSRSSLGLSTTPTTNRPRSHCFHVEPVDDSVLDMNSTVPSISAGQNNANHGGMTNASFVIDMNNTSSGRDTNNDGNGTNSTAHHVEFNTIPQIITQPPEGPSGTELPAANQITGEVDRLDPLVEVNSDQNSSTESLQFIKPDSNQCTVTSLTPLLSRDSSDSEPELTSGANVV